MEQRSKEWFKARKGRVTGSIVGAILGLNPWMSRDDAMRSMVRSFHGAESEFKGNIATEYGQENEPKATIDYEMISGNDVEEVGFFVHPDHDWLGASPDGFINGDSENDGTGILEIKCPFGKRHDVDNTFLPLAEQPHYYAQVQIEMYCTGLTWTHFYQWSAYNDRLEYIELDQDWLDTNIPILKEFYDEFVKECKSPERHLAPLIKSVKAGKAVEAYKAAKAHVELAQKQLDEAKADLIGIADGKKSNISGVLVYPVERKGSIEYAKLVKDMLTGVDVEPYRGKGSSYWTVK